MNINQFKLEGSGVYKIRNVRNGRFYIGSTIDFKRRISDHLKALTNGLHHSFKLQEDFLVYNVDDFYVEILDSCSEKIARLKEQDYINRFKPYYNVSKKVGEIDFVRDDEYKEKIRNTLTGRKQSVETCNKKAMVQKGDKHWTTRQKFSDESCKKMSETHKKRYAEGSIKTRKGVPQSDSAKQKCKEWMSGSIWVTNQIDDLLIQKDELSYYLDRGWNRGRSKFIGRIFINNGVQGKRVKKEDAVLFTGWVLGRLKRHK